jgi:hypothetical protein
MMLNLEVFQNSAICLGAEVNQRARAGSERREVPPTVLRSG